MKPTSVSVNTTKSCSLSVTLVKESVLTNALCITAYKASSLLWSKTGTTLINSMPESMNITKKLKMVISTGLSLASSSLLWDQLTATSVSSLDTGILPPATPKYLNIWKFLESWDWTSLSTTRLNFNSEESLMMIWYLWTDQLLQPISSSNFWAPVRIIFPILTQELLQYIVKQALGALAPSSVCTVWSIIKYPPRPSSVGLELPDPGLSSGLSSITWSSKSLTTCSTPPSKWTTLVSARTTWRWVLWTRRLLPEAKIIKGTT